MAGPQFEAGIKYAYASSVVHLSVERDAKGQITGTVEQRVPVPDLETPAQTRSS